MTRVMVVVRLFSGLVDGLASGEWRPTGVPAMARLLEGLAERRDIDGLTLFTVKDRETARRMPRAARLELPPLGRVHVLPYRRLPWGGERLELVLTEVEQTLRCLWLYVRFRPAASYFSYANFMIAGIFARLGLGRVVLRMMGIFPHHRRLAAGHGGLVDGVQRWLLAAPFDHVVCSEDGSGPERILPVLLRPGTKLSILLNGVDRRAPSKQAVEELCRRLGVGERPVVLYLGRLVAYKGCDEFVAAALDLLRADPDAADFVLVGGGERQGALARSVAAAGLGHRVRLVGAVPANEVPAYFALAQIYVSLNKHGNLSNANLEALAAGVCMVLPTADADTGADVSTMHVVPPAVAVRIEHDDMVRSLTATLRALLDDPARVAALGRGAAALAERLIRPWAARVADDIDIITGDRRTANERVNAPRDERHHETATR